MIRYPYVFLSIRKGNSYAGDINRLMMIINPHIYYIDNSNYTIDDLLFTKQWRLSYSSYRHSAVSMSIILLVKNKNISGHCTYGQMAPFYINTYIHTHFVPGGIAEVSQIHLRDTYVLPKLVSYEEHCRRDRWSAHRRLIAVYLRCKCY
jgi:hypothetical protein